MFNRKLSFFKFNSGKFKNELPTAFTQSLAIWGIVVSSEIMRGRWCGRGAKYSLLLGVPILTASFAAFEAMHDERTYKKVKP